jgi:hypothetical protein
VADWRADRIGTALRGENPTVLRRLDEGFAVIGDVQFLPGYCVLLTDSPHATRLTDLPRPRRLRFLADMELLGEAVERACARHDPAFRRVNPRCAGLYSDGLRPTNGTSGDRDGTQPQSTDHPDVSPERDQHF